MRIRHIDFCLVPNYDIYNSTLFYRGDIMNSLKNPILSIIGILALILFFLLR